LATSSTDGGSFLGLSFGVKFKERNHLERLNRRRNRNRRRGLLQGTGDEM